MQELSSKQAVELQTSDSYRPELISALDPDGTQRLDQLFRSPGIRVHDRIVEQLEDLVRCQQPGVRWEPSALRQAALERLPQSGSRFYGVWVHYPWSGRLVHLLPQEEFALVRTDRNRNKITREEQALLATKRIGVVGLSVGQSAAMTLALERGCGELRLADFDLLELSNLNRIRSGEHEMGEYKAVNTAREIAELDPFLKVVCYTEGITRENMDAFFSEGGELDLLVEECDAVEMKILLCEQARARRIPVVMDTSDRGLIDVERFDREPERAIMHGRLAGFDLQKVRDGKLAPDERFAYMVAMVDAQGLSAGMRSSLPEVGKTLITWPQLGGHVTLGGALVAEASRNIFLDRITGSGRWYIDLDHLLQPERSTLPNENGHDR